MLRSDLSTALVSVVPCFALSARAKPGKVKLLWTHQPGTVRYDIFRAPASDPSGFQKIGETTSTYSTYLDETVSNEATYLYTVAGISPTGLCFSSVTSAHPTASRTVANYPPVIYSRPIPHGTVGVPYNYDIQATDPNGNALTYSMENGPPARLSIRPSGSSPSSPATRAPSTLR